MILKKISASLDTEKVDVPELGKDAQIVVRQNTVTDVLMFHQIVKDRTDADGNMPHAEYIMAKLICSMVDDDGNHIAEPSEMDYLLKELQHDVVTRLYAVCHKLNPPLDEESTAQKKS